MLTDITDQVVAGVLIAVFIAVGVGIIRWFRNVRKLLVWTANQMANDGNGSWRSNINTRLTAIESALPGVIPSPESQNKPPLEK